MRKLQGGATLLLLHSQWCSATKFGPNIDFGYERHIAIAGDNGMAISWYSVEPYNTTSKVFYGLAPQLSNVIEGPIATTYWESGYHHHVVLDNLSPSTTYSYAVGSGDGNWSDIQNFTTVSDSSSDSIKFTYFGDLGAKDAWHKGTSTIDYLIEKKDEFELVWIGGDIGYADDAFAHPQCLIPPYKDRERCDYETLYNEFMKEIEPIAQQVPLMTLPGNHEAEDHSPQCLLSEECRDSLSNFTAYNTRFRMPSSESGGALNMYSSFNAGPVHFISMDLETGYPGSAEENRYLLKCGGFRSADGSDFLTWFENDLRKANESRHERPWIIVGGHHPMYCLSGYNKKMANAIEQLLYDYQVDLMLVAHVHDYERMWPTFNGTLENAENPTYVNPRATTHILVGGAGNDEMDKPGPGPKPIVDDDNNNNEEEEVDKGKQHFTRLTQAEKFALNPAEQLTAEYDKANYIKSSSSSKQTDVEEDVGIQTDFVAFTDTTGAYGISVINIMNSTHLHFEYIRTSTGEVHDEIWLVKDNHLNY
jgi:hypothetical protein